MPAEPQPVVRAAVPANAGPVAALHRRFGFTRAGLLSGVGRKHGRWVDTLLMQEELMQEELMRRELESSEPAR
jgi:L-amino acid N-acyltransferase YncA